MLYRWISFALFQKKINSFLKSAIPQEVLKEVFLCLYKNKTSYDLQIKKNNIGGKKIKKILFLSSAKSEKDGSFLYRCQFLMKELEKEDYSTDWNFIHKNPITNIKSINNCDLVVFSRAMDNKTLAYIHIAHLLGKVVTGDCDDPFFKHITPFFGSVLSKRSPLKKELTKAIAAEKIYPYYHAVICSTENLKREFENKSICSIVIPNKLNKSAIKKHLNWSFRNKKTLKLIYTSGTHTHAYDFSLYMDPLKKFLKKHPDVTLTILGKSNKKYWVNFSKQVTFLKRVSFSKMLSILKSHDLSLVFLDKNKFNECKSSIKFIESASSNTPVLATNTKEYQKSIVDEKTGFLISQPNELLNKLEEIYNNKQILLSIKENLNQINESDLYITQEHINKIKVFFKHLTDKRNPY